LEDPNQLGFCDLKKTLPGFYSPISLAVVVFILPPLMLGGWIIQTMSPIARSKSFFSFSYSSRAVTFSQHFLPFLFLSPL